MQRTFYFIVFIFVLITLDQLLNIFFSEQAKNNRAATYNLVVNENQLPQFSNTAEINQVLHSFKLARQAVAGKSDADQKTLGTAKQNEHKLLLDNIAIELKAIIYVHQHDAQQPKAILAIENIDDNSQKTLVLTVGDSFNGYVVSNITTRAVKLTVDDKKSKQQTPNWILELYKSNENHE